MQVSLIIAKSDSPQERQVALDVLSLVYGKGLRTPSVISPEDNPAVGGGVPPAPNAAPCTVVAAAPQIAQDSLPPLPTAIEMPAVPSVPAVLVAPAIPSGPANVGTPAFDSAGLPWDERIHSDTKSQNKDGTWRIKRGVDKAIVPVVEKQLRAQYGIAEPAALNAEQQAAANQWQVPGVAPEVAQAVSAGLPVTVDPITAATLAAASQASMQIAPTAVIPPAPQAPNAHALAAVATPPAAPIDPHAGFTRFITQVGPMTRTEANPAGALDAANISNLCQMLGVKDAAGNGSLIALRDHPHMIEALRNMLNQQLAANGATVQIQA